MTVTTVGYGDVYPVTVEGKIIAAFLMVVGIGVLGIFISTFGAALIESRLRMKKSDSAVEDQSPNLKELKSDIGTSIVHTPTNFNAEAKNFIKQKVDKIEKMNEKEINNLIDVIRTIHGHQADTNNDDTNTDVRSPTR